MKVYASLFACDFSCVRDELGKIKNCDGVHLDIMDGHFVPNISYGPDFVKAIRSFSSLPFDVHLMVTNPIDYIDRFAEIGCDSITFHVESDGKILDIVEKIKKCNLKVGIAIKPNTGIEKILDYLELLDLILIMTVEPGFGGQKFLGKQVDKISHLKKIVAENNLNTMLQVDGGINSETAKIVDRFGADCCVAGTAIFGSENYEKAIKILKN